MNIITPERVHGIVNRAQGSVFCYQGWPTVARDENGVLYAVASAFRVSHVCPYGKTALYISRDNGKTWTPPFVINDTYLDDRDAGILYMGNGRMLVTWFTHSADSYQTTWFEGIRNRTERATLNAAMGLLAGYDFLPEEDRRGGSYIRISEDYGVTWSDRIRVPVSAPHGPNLCRDGSLIYLGKEMWAADEIPAGCIAAYKSSDGGYTWTKLGVLSFPEGTKPDNFHEPHVIELPDGRLLGMIRAQGDGIVGGRFQGDGWDYTGYTLYSTVSEDGGKTWSEMTPTGLSGNPGHLLLHSSGALILTYGRRETPYGERAAVSYDLGRTWADEYIIDDRSDTHDLGYPSTVELDDGSLFSVYYQKCEGDSYCSTLCTNWKLK